MNFNFRNDKNVDLRQFSKYADYMLQTGWQVLKLKNGIFAYKRSLGIWGSIIKIQRFKLPIDLDEVDRLAKKHRVHFVKLEPDVNKIQEANELQKKFEIYGFKLDSWPLIPPKTRVINLKRNKKELLADCSENGRRNLKKAKKNQLVVTVTDNWKLFYPDWKRTAKKKHLVIPSLKNFEMMVKSFGKDFTIVQCNDKKGNWLGGMVMLIAKKKAYYYYATANKEGKKMRAPYLVTWTAMMEAKKRKCEIFDFEGVADSRFKETNDKAWRGFGEFKSKFGGEEVTYVGSFIKYYGMAKVLGLFEKALSLLHPNKLIEKVESNFQVIEVRTEFGKPRLTVDGVPQSGGIVQSILKKALMEFDNPKNFLLLGLGGGDILHEVHKRWPNSKIKAVELDPSMVRIANQYFKINKIPNLIVYTQDAYVFVKSEAEIARSKRKYDAILVDCYLGGNIPVELESDNFLKGLKKILRNKGIIVFNRLHEKEAMKEQINRFVGKLKKIFPMVKVKKAYCNIMVIVK